jgi:hypothetical protein
MRDGDDALMVNWCELIPTEPDGQVIYHNSFISNHAINADNVADILLASLNLLAFLCHTIHDMMDSQYQLIRAKL